MLRPLSEIYPSIIMLGGITIMLSGLFVWIFIDSFIHVAQFGFVIFMTGLLLNRRLKSTDKIVRESGEKS